MNKCIERKKKEEGKKKETKSILQIDVVMIIR
jgi:hypothetical protein